MRRSLDTSLCLATAGLPSRAPNRGEIQFKTLEKRLDPATIVHAVYCPVHNVQIVNLGAPVYKNALCRIQRHLLWNRINRVWDTGSYFEPNSIDTEL